jgi:hypothetical protein
MTVQHSWAYLDKALSENPPLRKIVVETYTEEYLNILDRLFQELYSNGCKGIKTKFYETSPELFRFQATISEMDFAMFFIKNKMPVELLSNNFFQGRMAPDIHAIGKSREYYVEVKNIELDEEQHNFGCKIAEYLNSIKLSYRVVLKAATCLSMPAYIAEERKKKEIICAETFEDFKEKVKGLTQSASKISIEMENADIDLHPTKKDKSYLGISTMKEAISQPDNYRQRIRYDITSKAQKRSFWNGKELDCLFIIALKDNSWLFGIDEYNVDLFGHCHYYMPPLKPPIIEIETKLAQAIARGWKDYMTKICILNNDSSVIIENQRGMFFTEPILTNVTAIIVENKQRHFLLANPFADERINAPIVLQEVGNIITGWE